MNVRKGLICLFAMLAGGLSGRAETVDEVAKDITAKMKALKSVTAKVRTETDMEGPGFKTSTRSDGQLEMLRRGDKLLTRMESRDSATTDVNGQVDKRTGTTLSIMDGEYVYALNDINGEKTATRMKVATPVDGDPFESLKPIYTLEVLPEEKIDGAACHVIKLTPKAGAGPGGTMLQYYRKDCGMVVKTVSNDASGKPLLTMTYSDVKLGADISPDRFVFQAPPGVTVVDMTQDLQQAPVAKEPVQPEEQQPAEEGSDDEPAPAKPKGEKKKGGIKIPGLP